jgi:hypothetical protein
MILAYLDESGNSGNNLTHPDQPIFCLSALLVPAASWVAIEADLFSTIEQFFPSPRPSDFEIHASELINPRGFFRSFPIQHRLDFLNAALSIARHHHLKVIYRAILNRRYLRWREATFGAGVIINPHLAAFPLVAHVVHNYLKTQPSSPLGIFISDENREIMFDVEKAQKILRGTPGPVASGPHYRKRLFHRLKKELAPAAE